MEIGYFLCILCGLRYAYAREKTIIIKNAPSIKFSTSGKFAIIIEY